MRTGQPAERRQRSTFGTATGGRARLPGPGENCRTELKFDMNQAASEELDAPHNWSFMGQSTPERAGARSMVARGRVTGGSSAINHQIVSCGECPRTLTPGRRRGTRNGATLRPCPISGSWKTDADIHDDFHGTEGPDSGLATPPRENWLPLQAAFLRGLRCPGHTGRPGYEPPGRLPEWAPFPLNNPGGVRMSTALTYLNACRHRLNLTIRANVVTVRQVLLDGKRTTGVRGGKRRRDVRDVEGEEDNTERGRHCLAPTVDAVGGRTGQTT